MASTMAHTWHPPWHTHGIYHGTHMASTMAHTWYQMKDRQVHSHREEKLRRRRRCCHHFHFVPDVYRNKKIIKIFSLKYT